jgi:hypothetical protein
MRLFSAPMVEGKSKEEFFAGPSVYTGDTYEDTHRMMVANNNLENHTFTENAETDRYSINIPITQTQNTDRGDAQLFSE